VEATLWRQAGRTNITLIYIREIKADPQGKLRETPLRDWRGERLTASSGTCRPRGRNTAGKSTSATGRPRPARDANAALMRSCHGLPEKDAEEVCG
jgi:hypothetical protein